MVTVTPQAPSGTKVQLPEPFGASVVARWQALGMWPVLATRDDALATLDAALAIRGPNAAVVALRAEIASDEEAGMVQFED